MANRHAHPSALRKRTTTLPRLASFVLVALLCRSGLSEEGLQLFHKIQAALGGADRIAAIRDFEQLVRAEAIDGSTGLSMGAVRKRTRWIRPNLVRVDQIGPGSTYVLYFDGASGWEILPGTQKVIELAGGELAFAQGYVRGFKLNTWLADRDSRFQITSPAPNVVRVSDGDPSHHSDIALDPVSNLPLRITTVTLSDPARPATSEEVTAEWETVQGIRFARRWTVFRNGARVAEATVEETRLNRGLKQAELAAKPADLKPAIPEATKRP